MSLQDIQKDAIIMYDKGTTTVDIMDIILKYPNQIFMIGKPERILHWLLIALLKKYPNRKFNQGYVISGGGFNFWIFYLVLEENKHIIINLDEANEQTHIYLYDETDKDVHIWREKALAFFGNDVPEHIDPDYHQVEWHYWMVFEFLFMYRNPNPYPWYFD